MIKTPWGVKVKSSVLDIVCSKEVTRCCDHIQWISPWHEQFQIDVRTLLWLCLLLFPSLINCTVYCSYESLYQSCFIIKSLWRVWTLHTKLFFCTYIDVCFVNDCKVFGNYFLVLYNYSIVHFYFMTNTVKVHSVISQSDLIINFLLLWKRWDEKQMSSSVCRQLDTCFHNANWHTTMQN